MLSLFALSALALTLPQEASDPSQVREIDAIDCRLSVPEYTGFALAVDGPEGIARARHWKEVASANPFMREYMLPADIVVAGAYRTRRIAFTADAILAILDVADPETIARGENIKNAMDPAPLLESLGPEGARRAEAEIKFRKFLGERVVKDETEKAGDGEAFGTHMTVTRSISNVTTHPGKTLYGCSYRMEMLDKDGKPL
ncbi:hypothetical protein HZY97_19645 [Sphingomonas sp. R-74633]|uniref:hypothetical protein n=1 Tax=Sphingomonas sp. R-74633 TaxID=2751188 RepID=UPI0015D2C29E|nr:hypothetical protein [Sphingomonas sp. R-74633]NYT42997.1 hypothetical protein [Sphingomonas sp. R-74633]